MVVAIARKLDERLHALELGVDLFDERDAEGGGLARPGLREADHVAWAAGTGARNESSVLFSLSALTGSAEQTDSVLGPLVWIGLRTSNLIVS